MHLLLALQCRLCQQIKCVCSGFSQTRQVCTHGSLIHDDSGVPVVYLVRYTQNQSKCVMFNNARSNMFHATFISSESPIFLIVPFSRLQNKKNIIIDPFKSIHCGCCWSIALRMQRDRKGNRVERSLVFRRPRWYLVLEPRSLSAQKLFDGQRYERACKTRRGSWRIALPNLREIFGSLIICLSSASE